MSQFTDHFSFMALRIRVMMKLEPAIRPDFSKAGLKTVVSVILCLIEDGVDEASAIYRYLQERGCKFDRDAIDFLIQVYEGTGLDHHLWTRTSLGAYVPLVGRPTVDPIDSLRSEFDWMSEAGN